MLIDWPLDAWDEGAIPETEARQEHRQLSLPAAGQEVMGLLTRGDISAVKVDVGTGDVFLKAPEEWTKVHGTFVHHAGGARPSWVKR